MSTMSTEKSEMKLTKDNNIFPSLMDIDFLINFEGTRLLHNYVCNKHDVDKIQSHTYMHYI